MKPILYVVPGCSSCRLVKTMLENVVPFEERDAVEWREYLIARRVTSIPVLEADGKFYTKISEIKKIMMEKR